MRLLYGDESGSFCEGFIRFRWCVCCRRPQFVWWFGVSRGPGLRSAGSLPGPPSCSTPATCHYAIDLPPTAAPPAAVPAGWGGSEPWSARRGSERATRHAAGGGRGSGVRAVTAAAADEPADADAPAGHHWQVVGGRAGQPATIARSGPMGRLRFELGPTIVEGVAGSARRRPTTAPAMTPTSAAAAAAGAVTGTGLARAGSGRWRRSGGGWGALHDGGPASLPPEPQPQPQPLPETEQECAEVFQERIRAAHGRQLLPLVEDLADWINKTLGLDCVTGDNFFDVLDNGALLCRLARLIHERAQALADRGDISSTQVPVIRGRCWDNAARRSFFSRDNMENFIQFCRRLGVHENLIFESDDLVLHNQPRSVVLCLLEVSRLAARLGVEPAGLVQLEREIAEEEQRERDDSLLSWQFRASPALTPRASPDKMRHSSSSSAISMSASGNRWGKGRPRSGDRRSLMLDSSASPPHDARRTVSEGHAASDGVPSDATEVDDDWSRGSADADGDADQDDADGELELDGDGSRAEDVTELDRKVQQATRLAQRQCHCPSGRCPKLKVRKVGEGKYNIAGRNVFVRLLKGRHMMVRVGGGWDTLDHFLLRHDPCQVKGHDKKRSKSPDKRTLQATVATAINYN
ncbi:uncharacterized protein LOC126281741 [Schistocerca gregaria]|uniref:uncharacterized protein LOC126281741 n=1 Tax=Schistocerca gregaria TaxID=7010 RepID=UPI00211F3CDD|nr:uncharacterized protein LOC126281741 [Schistocerca gregaria]